jgi:anthranilate phosphoribosyltransferase
MAGKSKKTAQNAWWASRLYMLQSGRNITREDARQAWNLLWEQWAHIKTDWLKSRYLPEKLRLALAFGKVDPFAMMIAPTFLMGLTAKGISADELAGLTDSFIDHGWFREYEGFELPDPDAVYSNGFGGDGVKTINVSTGAMIIAAAAGASCYKMGSRTYFSHSGSHNFLEVVGVKASADPRHAVHTLRTVGLAYIDGVATCDGPTQSIGTGLSVMPDAKELMKAMTYPFRYPILCLNPLKPKFSARGVSTLNTEVPAQVIRDCYPYTERLEVVAGMTPEKAIIDEVSTVGPTKITELVGGELITYTTQPEDWGVRCAQTSEIRCSDPWLSAVKNMAILRGICNDANKDLLLVNAGQFLYVAGKAKTRKEGTEMARAAVDDGRALDKLRAWVEASGGEIGVFEMMVAAAGREDAGERMKHSLMLGKTKPVETNAA